MEEWIESQAECLDESSLGGSLCDLQAVSLPLAVLLMPAD
jgi:hypothetical protein